MPNRFSIDQFKAKIDQNKGLAKPNRFFVSFTAPSGIAGFNNGNLVEFLCDAANLPGHVLFMGDGRRYTYGPNEKRPFAPQSGPLQLQIMADGAGEMWNFFHNWLSFIQPHTMKNGIWNQVSANVAGSNASTPYELEYRENYVTDVAIYHLHESYDNSENDFITRTVCRECFPSNVTDIQLNWADNNNIAKFSVQMEFLEWYNTNDNN